MKLKMIFTLSLLVSLISTICACEKIHTSTLDTESENTEMSITQTSKSTNVQDTTSETIVNTPNDTNSLSLTAYKMFLENKMRISFPLQIQSSLVSNDMFDQDRGYSLLEILEIINSHYFESSLNNKINILYYSYLDCGNDGVQELILKFEGLDLYSENDESSLVFIIKYINGKLYFCHSYENWDRSETVINEYGYYESGGSGGATNHAFETGLIDINGNWKLIYRIESEADLNQLIMSNKLQQIPFLIKEKGVSGDMEVNTISFENYGKNIEQYENKLIYSFRVFDEDGNLIVDPNLYTDSKYQTVFEEANVVIITPDQLKYKIAEKEKNVGATSDIKAGKELTWKALNDAIYSDWVGK